MTDVEMQDAATDSVPSKSKTVAKAGKSAAADTTDNKKRFEVKKVRVLSRKLMEMKLTYGAVECRCPMGMGHRR